MNFLRTLLAVLVVPLLLAAPSTTATPASTSYPRIGMLEDTLHAEIHHGPFPGLAVGIVRGGELVYARGFGHIDCGAGEPPTAATLFPVGSLAKPVTATLLMALRDRALLALDDPLREHLPPSVSIPARADTGAFVTLRQLATHTSGLPRLPPNMRGRHDDPYAGFSLLDLLAAVEHTELDTPPGATIAYSNFGYALLGQALAYRASTSFDELAASALFRPLEMHRTQFSPRPEDGNVAVGCDIVDPRSPVEAWNFGAMAPAGGLWSSVDELARFMALQLRAWSSGDGPLRGASIGEMQSPQRAFSTWDGAMGLGWMIEKSDNGHGTVMWHTGTVSGGSSYLGFSPYLQVGVIVLTNRWTDVHRIGRYILHRVAIPLYGVPDCTTCAAGTR